MMQLLPDLFPLSLTCGMVILLLLLLTPVLSRRFTPRWRYWAWLFVAVRLVLPFSLSWHPVELSTPTSLTAPSYDPQMSREMKQASPYGWQCGTAGGTTYQVWYTDDQHTEHRIVDLMLVRLEGVDGAWSASFRWNYIWAAGGTVSLALLVLGYLRLCRQMARRRQPPSRAAQEELERQRRLLSVTRRVRLFQVPGLASPLLMGFLHPTVLLPYDLPSAALPVALAHELQHLKRRDLWYKLLLSLAGCVHWFNPLVWLMVRKGEQDVELCCDYDLLKARDMAGRRAYGQAILDQMTAGDKNLSRLTTGFSGDKKEVFARFKAMMDTAPKHRGRAALAAALAVVVLAGGLVGCQNGASTPEGDGAWIEGIDLEAHTVTYYPLSQELIADEDALYEWVWGEDGMGAEEPRTVPLNEDSQFLHTYRGETYSIPPATLQFSVAMSQTGTLGEVEVEGGEAARVQLASAAYLDLSAPALDFTGWCGTVYAAGMGGIRFQQGADTISVDPCDETGEDDDHTYYTLPLAREATVPEEYLDFLSGASSAQYPHYWKLTVVNGEVTAVGAIGEAAESEPEATFANAYDHYNQVEGALSGFIVSQAVHEGQSCDEFYHEARDVTLYVFSAEKGGLCRAEVLWGGQSRSLEFPVHPMVSYAYGNAAGTAALRLADLTGDGSPELVYIWGMGGTGTWESHCTVLDLSSMEELPVVLDFDALTAGITLTLAEQGEEQLIFRVTGPDGQSALVAKDWHYPEGEVSEEIAADFYYDIFLSDGQLTVEAAFDPVTAPMPTSAPLGTLTAPLVYDPASRSFQLSVPPEILLYQPVEATP